MKTLTITQSNFLDWYFDDESESESIQIREQLAEKVIEQLNEKNVSTITTRDIFNECNPTSIRINFLEEFEEIAKHEDDDRQINELKFECKVILID